MTNLELILEAFPEDDFLRADGFDEAIIGVCGTKLVYSISKCIAILEKDMSYEDAVEYFFFNTESAYVGEQTPIWVDDMMFGEQPDGLMI